MKHFIITCIAVLAFASVSMSQGRVEGTGGGVLSTGQQSYITNYSTSMSADLNLTEEQRKLVEDQTSAHYLNQQSVHNNELNNERMNELNRAEHERFDHELRQIFNEEQYRRYKENNEAYRLEYQQEQRATPTQEGTQAQPRHGE